MHDVLTQFKAARRVSTPLLAIRTADPRATVTAIHCGYDAPPPMLQWDAAAGLSAANSEATALLTDVAGKVPPGQLRNPAEMLTSLRTNLPAGAIVFFINAHRFLDNVPTMQAIWNLRDEFKRDKRTLVMLVPEITLPRELTNDVIVLDESLPNEQDLFSIIDNVYKDAGMHSPLEAERHRAVDATLGLTAFAAEQAAAMCLTKDGLEMDALWERKRQMVEQTPGLSIWREGQTFSDVAGYENAKNFLLRVLTGRRPPRAVVFVDEIEKMFAGLGSDTSGVTTSLLGTLLSWMQDTKATGNIFIGPPGSGKSLVAKAAGNTGEIPTISFDMTGMKASLVGQSEQQLRAALKVVDAIAQGRTLFIATCNSIHALPPELRRRFRFGTFFFDLPSNEERAQIWSYYFDQYDLESWQVSEGTPTDDNWTGAEIAQCADNAYTLRCSLKEAAQYIIPVAVSARQEIDDLRTSASGKYLSASRPGLYDRSHSVTVRPSRSIHLEGE